MGVSRATSAEAITMGSPATGKRGAGVALLIVFAGLVATPADVVAVPGVGCCAVRCCMVAPQALRNKLKVRVNVT